MTMIFPDGQALARELNRAAPESFVEPECAARALAVAAEMHHFQFTQGGRAADAIGASLAFQLGIPLEAGIAAWYSAMAVDDLYSVLDSFSLTVLEALQSKGIKTAAVSNASNCLKAELAAHGLLGGFDVAIGSNEGYREKPHAEMFEAAIAALGVDKARTWHVGDGLINDVLGSARAGVGVQVLVDRYGIYSDPPCLVVRSMRHLYDVVAHL
jgi:FMN phosphatase YigB (HAD superfamily)